MAFIEWCFSINLSCLSFISFSNVVIATNVDTHIMENLNFTLSEENENKATIKQLVFILNHAEKQLLESLKSADEVLNRSTILTGLLFGIITSSVGYLTAYVKTDMRTPFFWSVIVVLGYNWYLLMKIKSNILGATYRTIGREPKNVFHDETYDKSNNSKTIEKEIYKDCINRYQGGIEHNNFINKERWLCFRNTLKLTIYTPAVFIGVYILLFLYSSLI